MDIGPKYQVSNSDLVRIILKDHWTWKIRSWLTCCFIFLFGAIVFCYPTPVLGFSLFRNIDQKKTFLGGFFFALLTHITECLIIQSYFTVCFSCHNFCWHFSCFSCGLFQIGEEEKKETKVVWDGHTASIEKISQLSRENISIEEQIATIHRAKGLV